MKVIRNIYFTSTSTICSLLSALALEILIPEYEKITVIVKHPK